MKVVIPALLALLVLSGCASTTKQTSLDIKKEANQKADLTYLPVGEWRLGDSRQKVTAMPSLPNLTPVKVTGGLETSDATFEGKKRNISFVFNDDQLVYSQVWLYEGKKLSSAIEEFDALFQFFSAKLQGARINGIDVSGGLNSGALRLATEQLFTYAQKGIEKASADTGNDMTFILTLDLIPFTQPLKNKLHGKFVYSGQLETFYVFLFEDLPNSESRTSPTQVNLVPRES